MEPTARAEAFPSSSEGEVVAGKSYVSPRPAAPQALAKSVLAGELMSAFGRTGRRSGDWIFLIEPRLHLGADVLVPDLTGWRRERMQKLPSVAALTLAPEWVCEVLSPETHNLDRGRKLAAYARAGVRHVWLVDPAPHMRTLEVFRLQGPYYAYLAGYEDGRIVHAEPFEALPLELKVLWEDVE
ncbi:Uma2 family endonuclease [Corallococcus aberystwythensis]|uniref:Uma2 family endonuclease n=1 Tax=Corallococcus aberystwythensis TaxID=2316722 RepID=A0A3A8PTY0_9BACT|nr:Uma2 family endonuclease [Corallococcus aberystwythensis]RKH57185.1 Uma2 family endonuclease [Corallococcus aberystwythensis]